MKYEELFQQKDLWQENAFNKIKESLLSVRDNPLLRYDTMRKKYLVVKIPDRKINPDSEYDWDS